jgi:arylsulfatase A-like enzyme
LAASILLTSLGVGVLAGLVEICWAYLLPMFSEQWRATLPRSTAGLLSFCAAAVATDGVLVLFGGTLLLILLALLTRVTRLSTKSARLRVVARAAILGGTACYLFNGWIALFLLCSGDQETSTDRLIAAAGSVTLLSLALLGSAGLEAARRRWHQVTPVAVWFTAVIILLVVTAPAFWRYRASHDPRRKISISNAGPRPNILLVTLDTLRSDYVGCYGHPWIETPTLDELAADGFAFDAAISQAPSTTPSHCSLMTSVYPFDHGAENGRPMKPDLITLADVLRAAGYETTAFASATTTRSINTGLQQGFDRYVDSLVSWSELFGRDEFQHLIFFYLAGFARDTQIPGEVVTDRALRWLENRPDKPFFTWLHYFDPHEPYGSPPPFRDMYKGIITDGRPLAAERQRYAEDITYADFELGRFLDTLKRKSLYDETLIIVTSDHGEAFGETHAHIVETGHGHYLSDVTQRVPLIIKPAGPHPRGRRVNEQVELIDLAPTVLNLLGIEPPAGFCGNSFAALLDSRSPAYTDRYAYAFNVVHVARPGAEPDVLFLQQLAVRSNEWKYIARPRLGEAELYDLRQDPHERTNLAGRYPDIAARLHAQIAPFWNPQRDRSEDPRQGLAPALVRELQALGYLAESDDE